MIALRDQRLSGAALKKLAEHQREIDGLADYEARVISAKKRFSSLNKKGNATFDAVKATLTKMCSGARRCVYCEDSAADEVEHIRPKDLYPEMVFVWMNYLYACGPCNGPKNNHFAVFAHNSGTFTVVTRTRGASVIPPVTGDPVLIDPRKEDPLELMVLDLRDTFCFAPRAPRGSAEFQRAEYTIHVLHLNDRDFLPEARYQAYRDYKAHLSHYLIHRDRGAPAQHLRRIAKDVRRRQHPTVWAEMKRQHARIPELSRLFRAAPEALGW